VQIPKDVFATSNLCIAILKQDSEPDHNLCYCPYWTAPNKHGRPKKDARKKSVLENATGTKKKLKKAQVLRELDVTVRVVVGIAMSKMTSGIYQRTHISVYGQLQLVGDGTKQLQSTCWTMT
jgi:hypothetical protein